MPPGKPAMRRAQQGNHVAMIRSSLILLTAVSQVLWGCSSGTRDPDLYPFYGFYYHSYWEDTFSEPMHTMFSDARASGLACTEDGNRFLSRLALIGDNMAWMYPERKEEVQSNFAQILAHLPRGRPVDEREIRQIMKGICPLFPFC